MWHLRQDGDVFGSIVEKYQSELIIPKEVADMKEMAKNYRNKTNYYDNSTRSALFSRVS